MEQVKLQLDERKIELPLPPVKLRVEGLSYRYGDQEVLKDLNFELKTGELLGFLGPNGAGKSTTFQIIAGLLPVQQGTFMLDGKTVNPLDPRTRDTFGVVFQQPSLDLKLSAMENLLLSAALYRVSRKEAKARARQLLHFMDLHERVEDRVESFSGGMRRRLEIVRALIHAPQFLILDEPTTGLDEAGFQKVWQRLLELRKQANLTMLLTTHRADEAEKCDRLIILDQGKILADEAPAALKERIGGDVLVLDTSDKNQNEIIIHKLQERFSVKGKIVEGKIVLEQDHGHEFIPKLVEAFPPQTFFSINMHRPTLADVFLRLTGRTLSVDTEQKAEKKRKR